MVGTVLDKVIANGTHEKAEERGNPLYRAVFEGEVGRESRHS